MRPAISNRARLSVGEYLRLEATSERRHEFHDGRRVPVPVQPYVHSVLCAAVAGEIHRRLRGTPFQVTGSVTRICTHPGRHYVYPDAVVVEGPPRFDPADSRSSVLNPTLVVEVLSDSTEAYDRGKKFERYRAVQTLREYVLVLTTEPRVETFLRRDDGSWILTHCAGLDAVAKLRSIEVDLPLAEVYDRVKFPDPGEGEAAPDAAGDPT